MPNEDDALTDAIRENVTSPQSVTVDGNTATQHSLSEQIAAAKFLASKKAVKSKRRGLNYAKFRPEGTV